MKIRAKRFLAGFGLLLLVVITILTVLEWQRRRQLSAAGPRTLDGAGTVVVAEDLEASFRDPDEFARLCDDVQERSDALQQRFLHATHTRKTLTSALRCQGSAGRHRGDHLSRPFQRRRGTETTD